ncbi:GNAT family N-acetyltransferase [Aquimarina sp. 2201CG5-10]|uniref:GNAT family N-acetyltransferase n=1 Tax=Aquimarina callyspongiae TaxID=3098150 RepID=UPI002AB427FC|nr:GNAT family N-acetyltransferase [Aquimarina sp. 2201CG5-10]MDY8138433.1 GNAT family N-acetyltransferase [Aquimarina sp. 2201CG5-10]
MNSDHQEYIIRDAQPDEFKEVGQLMIHVYSKLKGFPSKKKQPAYYNVLANIGELTKNPKTRLLIAVTSKEQIGGAVIYLGDMKFYGSGGSAPNEKNASGFRLLAVNPTTRGKGIGKQLVNHCIELAREEKQKEVVIHSTKAMEIAWGMYEKIGFKRSEDLDFMQGELPVYGFRLIL